MKRKTLIIILSIVAAVLIAGTVITINVINSNKCKAHTYDNPCDAICNVCGETREVGDHQWAEANCVKPKTCEACGVIEGNALGHTAEEDDGNCTTPIHCIKCTEVVVAAKDRHIASADDGDCTTEVICTDCEVVLLAAMTHDFEDAEWHSDAEGHWHVCKNSNCDVTDTKIAHISSGAATEEKAETCTVCEYVIAPKLEHSHSYTVTKHNDTEHWFECVCGTKSSETVVAHSATSDNDCMTADKCSCGYTVTEAKDHVAGEDDGNCKTPIGCENCDNDAVAGRIDHIDTDHDYSCDNPGCQVILPGAPKDDNEGIDLPIDRN